MARWLLLDGYNLAFRSYYAIKQLSRSDGFPTNALHGWLNSLWRLERDYGPARTVVFFDLGGAARQEALLETYKAQRTEMPIDLAKQMPYLKAMVHHLGYNLVEVEGVEADDLIGSSARALAKAGEETLIVSADKDLGQCVGGCITQLLPPPSAKLPWKRLDSVGVTERFGVGPQLIPDFLALVGDTVDNIPGVPGVGPKTAAKWLQQYGSLEAVIENCGTLKPPRFQALVYNERDNLRRNLQLTTLDPTLPPPEFHEVKPNPEGLLALLKEMEMRRAYAEAKGRMMP